MAKTIALEVHCSEAEQEFALFIVNFELQMQIHSNSFELPWLMFEAIARMLIYIFFSPLSTL